MADPNHPLHPRMTQTTEWDDILIEKGIRSALDNLDIPEAEGIVYSINNKFSDSEAASHSDTDDLLLDSENEEDVLAKYRAKRIAEMSKITFMDITEISKSDFLVEVNEASKSNFTIVFLYNPSCTNSQLLEVQLKEAAKEWKYVKIVKILSQRCIENYPEKNVPTLLFYSKGECLTSLVGKGQCEDWKYKVKSFNGIPTEE